MISLYFTCGGQIGVGYLGDYYLPCITGMISLYFTCGGQSGVGYLCGLNSR